jgi:Protein of unknown function (DUF3592)
MPTSQAETPVRANAFGCITIPFLLLAFIPLAWGARVNWTNGQLARDGEVVTGRVIELRFVADNSSAISEGTRDGKGRGESAVVAFTTRAREKRTAVSSVNRHPVPWKVDEAVEVVYDPADPGRADLQTEVSGWRFWFGIWCAVAAVPLGIASVPIALLLRQRRAHRHAHS